MSNAKSNSAPTRYRKDNATSTAYTITKGGLWTVAALSTAGIPVFSFGDSLVANLFFFGAHASAPNNKDFLFRIWLAWSVFKNKDEIDPTVLLLMYYGAGQATLSNAVQMNGAAASTGLTATDYLADTLAFTLATDATAPKGPATLLQTGLSEGTVQQYSPGDDSPSMLIVPCLGRAAAFVVDFDNDGGSAPVTSSNCLITAKAA